MKILMTLIAILFFSTSSFAGELSESEVMKFLNEWLSAQNTGSYSNYATMYSNNFTGIKRSGSSTSELNYDAWLKDRKKMFSKKMVVAANNPVIKVTGTTASIKFEQIWASSTYKDKGDKLLNLATENGKWKIIREEMLVSKVVPDTHAVQTSLKSKFTSTKDKDCKKIQSHNMITFFGSDTVRECPAPKEWRLFKEYDSEGIRSWIRLSNGSSIWTTINQVWGDDKYEFGHFPNINSSPIEWRIKESGEPTSLIFQVTAQNPENPFSNLIRFFVISLADNIPRLCGMVKTNKEARDLAEKTTMCTTVLEKNALPIPVK